jgi:transcriptional regulator with XRE-family HTH domain
MSGTPRVSGNRIREARVTAGMSQSQLAGKIRTSEKNIRRWENETNAPRFDSVAAIAKATGRDLEFFLNESEEADDEAALQAMATEALATGQYDMAAALMQLARQAGARKLVLA